MRETITVVGNLGADPEQRTTPGGIPFALFSVGSTRQRYAKDRGEWVDDGTSWYRVVAYRRFADHVLSSFHRGDRVIVAGRLEVRTWENDTGKHVTAEITADALGHELSFGSSAFTPDRRRAGDPAPDPREESTPSASDAWTVPGADVADEAVPF